MCGQPDMLGACQNRRADPERKLDCGAAKWHIASNLDHARPARRAVQGIAKLGPRAVYLLLLAVQTAAALFFISRELPDFRQLALYPGEQLAYMRSDDLATICALFAMQVAYWVRVHRVPIPFRGPNALLSHLLLFLGRLSFIFGGSLFAVVFFRHLPELDHNSDTLLMARRGALLVGSLFALFCFALELERLGNALDSGQRH
jgi:hypothetical protein